MKRKSTANSQIVIARVLIKGCRLLSNTVRYLGYYGRIHLLYCTKNMTNLRLKLWHRPDASSNLVGFWDNLGDWSTSSWFFHEIWASAVLGTRNSLHWMHFAQSIHQRPATRRSVCFFASWWWRDQQLIFWAMLKNTFVLIRRKFL